MSRAFSLSDHSDSKHGCDLLLFLTSSVSVSKPCSSVPGPSDPGLEVVYECLPAEFALCGLCSCVQIGRLAADTQVIHLPEPFGSATENVATSVDGLFQETRAVYWFSSSGADRLSVCCACVCLRKKKRMIDRL